MKRLSSYNDKQQLHFIFSSEKLKNKLTDYIYSCEFNYISDKIDCFGNSIDYNIETYNRNYFKYTNSHEFLDGVCKSIKTFGCSLKLQKLYSQCKRLIDTNLFGFMCDKLAQLYYSEEIKEVVEYVEHLRFCIHRNVLNSALLNYIECFTYNYCQNIFINNDNEIIEIVKH